jgi:hypothetical protein
MARSEDYLAPPEDEEAASPFVHRTFEPLAAGLERLQGESGAYSPWQAEMGYEGETLPAGAWIGNGTPGQIAFRERVLASHKARSQRRSGRPRRDLTKGERRRVAGTRVEMATAAAAAAGRLLEAANRDLVTARGTANPDAVNTIRITASSGYRGQEHQASVWQSLFKTFYNRTLGPRQALAGGPHSDEAVRYMLDVFGIPKRVAAPGYSNHQSGIAIDFWQERNPGKPVKNDSSTEWRAVWRKTWFWDWLNRNAATHYFKPYQHEEWHWEYKPGAQKEDEFLDSAFEADEDFYGSQAEDESFPGEEEHDGEGTYEFGEGFTDESTGEERSTESEDNERYDPESEDETPSECARCGRSGRDSENARFETEETEDPLAEDLDTSQALEEASAPVRVEKLFEVSRKGHKTAYRLASGAEPRPFFFRTGMSTDYDGAPTAYHPNGRAAGALDHIANAGRPGNWWGIVTTNGHRDGTPYVQQPGRPERDPNPGFYVSPTSLPDTRFERTDPRRYVDATKVPYVALPAEAQDRGRKPLRGGAKLGDLAAVVNLKNGRVAYAIFADSGPRGKLGEGSAALGSALGRKGSEELDLVYVVFPGSRKLPPWPLSLATIDREGARRFSEWGGVALVKRLVASGMPLANRATVPVGSARVPPLTVPAATEPTTGRIAPFAIPSPRGYNLRGRRRKPGHKMFGIVVHTTGTTPAIIAERDAEKRAELGCVSPIDCALALYAKLEGFPHYLIGYDGTTYATCPEDYYAYHAGWVAGMGGSKGWTTWKAPAWWSRVWGVGRTPLDLIPKRGGPNSSYFGIELLGSKTERFTDPQYQALARLIVDIDQRNGLGIDRAPSRKLLGHEDLNPLTGEFGRANARGGWDPGAHRIEGVEPNFSWSTLWSFIEQRRRTPELEEDEGGHGEADAETAFVAESFQGEDEDEAPTA